jgi:hypothetical protein
MLWSSFGSGRNACNLSRRGENFMLNIVGNKRRPRHDQPFEGS